MAGRSTSHRRIDGSTVEFVTDAGGAAHLIEDLIKRASPMNYYTYATRRGKPGMSNGRINRGRARATRPENNKIYILICVRTSSRPTSKESRCEIATGRRTREDEEGGGSEAGVCHAAWVRAARRGDEKGTKTVRHARARVETDPRINSSKNRRGETISQRGVRGQAWPGSLNF